MVEKFYELKEKLEANMYSFGITTYNILEKSEKFGTRIYQVNMLEVEIESDEIVIITDIDLMLVESNYILREFMIESVENIVINDTIIEIFFINGNYVSIVAI